MRLPADDEERDARTQSAIKFVLDTQRAQYQRELAWEKDHPRTPAGPPEKLHIEFIDDPNIIAPVARSEIGWRIFHRSRRWQEWLERKTAAENARRATLADRDLGLINVQPRAERRP
jgi:hypothetical protein